MYPVKCFIAIVAMLFLTAQEITAQCPEGDVEYISQSQINAFARLYPNCTEIDGMLTIGSYSSRTYDIHDLSPLSKIKRINGGLLILNCHLLEDMDTFQPNHIGGEISLSYLDKIQHLDFLNNLDTLYGIGLLGLPKLQNIDALMNFEEIQGNLHFSDLPALSTPVLLKVKVINGYLNLSDLQALKNLTFLSNLESVYGLWIRACNALTDISGIDFIKNDPEYLYFTDNINLLECSSDQLCSLYSRINNLRIDNNGIDCESSLQVLSSCSNMNISCPVGDLEFSTQSELQLFSDLYADCNSLYGSLSLSSSEADPIYDLSPLSFIDSIYGSLSISRTDINHLNGLQNLVYIQGSLNFRENDKLENLSGISSLNSVASLNLNRNNSLFTIESLPFLNKKLQFLSIIENENLLHLNGIEKLDTLIGVNIANNQRLAQIDSLFSINYIDGIYINQSPGLLSINPKTNKANVVNSLTVQYCDVIEEVVLGPQTTINEDIRIWSNSALVNIEIPSLNQSIAYIDINENNQLISLTLSPVLEYIEEDLRVRYCDNLASLDFLNIKSVMFLELAGLDNISSLGSNSNFDTISHLVISNNPKLADIQALNRDIHIDSITLVSNTELTECQILPICNLPDLSKIRLANNGNNCNALSTLYSICQDSLKNPVGDVVLNSHIDLDILKTEYPNADSIYGGLYITNYENLKHNDLEYFSQIESIGDGIYISGSDIDSLDYLKDIAFNKIRIAACPNLNSFPLWSKIDTMDEIEFLSLERLSSLAGFANLKVVTEGIDFYNLNALTSLNGFQNLSSVESLNFSNCAFSDVDELNNITELAFLRITYNDFLTDLSGLSNITECYNIDIFGNQRLTQMMEPLVQDSLYYLYMNDNASLESFNSFDNVTSCGRIIRVINHDALTSLSFPSLEILGTNTLFALQINGNAKLKDISFPMLSYCTAIDIYNNEMLETLGEFPLLEASEKLEIYANDKLNDISVFNDQFRVNGSIEIYRNENLSICDQAFLCNYIYEGKELILYHNNTGCETEAQIEIACGYNPEPCPSSGYLMSDNRDVELYNTHYQNCTAIPGDLVMLDDFGINPQIQNLEMITEDLDISTRTIPSLSFDNLEYIGRNLFINDTYDMETVSFPALSKMNSRFSSRFIHISDNEDLISTPSFESLEDLQNYQILISNNPKIIEIGGFENLKTANRIEITSNPELLTIDGFDNIESLNSLEIAMNNKLQNLPILYSEMMVDEIILTDNPQLKNCSIEGICKHLDNDRTATILNNASGCNDKDEILSNCIVNVNEVLTQEYFTVYPNPTEGRLQVINEQDLELREIYLLDISGKLIANYPGTSTLLDISNLHEGIYLLQLHTEQGIATAKVVKW